MRVVFAGTPDFAAASLNALLNSDHQVVAVYAQPDRPAGRRRRTESGPVATLALDHGIPLEQPESLRHAETRNRLAAYEPQIMVVAAYGLILPQAVLDIPERGCLNVHASLLPRWRGAAPIQWAIASGDTETGITIMQMNAGLDTGDILLARRLPIEPDDTGGSLHNKLAPMGGQTLLAALERIDAGKLAPRSQEHGRATYARKLEREDSHLDWSLSAPTLARRIRAFNPWPVCTTIADHMTIKLLFAEPLNCETTGEPPGKVLKRDRNGALIQCGQGLLKLTRVQLPGGKPQTLNDIINGGKAVLEPGQRLGE